MKKIGGESRNVELKPPIGGRKSLLISESLRLNRIIRERITETQNSAVTVFGIIFVGEIEQKQAIWCLKRKSLN